MSLAEILLSYVAVLFVSGAVCVRARGGRALLTGTAVGALVGAAFTFSTFRGEGAVFGTLALVPYVVLGAIPPLMFSAWRRRAAVARGLRRIVPVFLGLLAAALVVAGVFAVSEWTASRLWSRCRAVHGRSLVEVERSLRREGVVVPVRCRRDDGVLDCGWRSLLGNRYGCAYEIRDGEATLLEGSG